MRKDPTSEKSDLYKFKMTLFDNGNPEEFFLFMQNFKMTPEALDKLFSSVKLHYLPTVLHGKAPCQIDTFYDQTGSTNTPHLNRIILGVGTYFYLLTFF